MICPYCKEEIMDGAIKCKHCSSMLTSDGAAVATPVTVVRQGRNKVVAALFAFFLGGLGIHRFYLGEIGWGIVYILICWTFIPAIMGVIEGIIFLAMSEEKFNKRYNMS